MPKMKSRRNARGRFRLTASGNVKRQHSCAGHIMTKKSTKRKRNLRHAVVASEADSKRLRRMFLV